LTKADQAILSLIRRLEKTYERPEPMDLSPEDELIYSFLLWEGITPRANAALKRITDAMADVNELRVTRVEGLVGLIGKTYPYAEERAERLLLVLDDVYKREHAVSLDHCVSMSKREGRKYLDSLDAIPPFVAARTALYALEAHAVPLDDRTLDKLIDAGLIEEDATVEKSIAKLERIVKSGDGPAVHELLQAWAEDAEAGVPPAAKKSGSKRRKTAMATR